MLKINVVITGTWTGLVARANFMKNASTFCIYLHLFHLFLFSLTHVISIIISLIFFSSHHSFISTSFPNLIRYWIPSIRRVLSMPFITYCLAFMFHCSSSLTICTSNFSNLFCLVIFLFISTNFFSVCLAKFSASHN